MNPIDIMSKTLTTPQVIKYYRKQGFVGMLQLHRDIEGCSEGNRRAIQGVLGSESECYARPQMEREVLEDADIIKELRNA